jgi:uncharacterized protein (TIGR00369 family)
MTSLDDSIGAYLDAIRTGRHALAGFRMRDVPTDHGELAVEVTVDDSNIGPAGSIHGGLLATLVDYVGARIATNGLDAGVLVATSDLTIHYLAAIKTSALAVGTTVKRGKRSVVVRVDVHDGSKGRLGATSTIQFSIIRPKFS